MWFLLYISVCVEGFLCRCVHCVNTNLQTPSFFCLQVWVYTECATWRQQGHSFVSLINIDTVCILCVGVQQRHTHVCLSLCDWLHWDFVQTELRFSLALLSVCVNAHVSLYVSGYSVCASVFCDVLSVFVLCECMVAPSRPSYLHYLHRLWMEAAAFL